MCVRVFRRVCFVVSVFLFFSCAFRLRFVFVPNVLVLALLASPFLTWSSYVRLLSHSAFSWARTGGAEGMSRSNLAYVASSISS